VKPHFSTPLIALNPVVIDTETNGLDVTNARIIQLGAVCIADGQVRHDAVLEFLVNPNEPIPAATTAIHGISDQMVADADPFGVVAAPFVKFIGDAAILGHNVGFDLAMLTREFSLAGMDWVTPPFLDTMSLARIVNPVLPNYSLDLVAEWLNIDIENRHSALGDATTTAHVFLALIPRLRKAGIRTIADAQRASVALSQRLSEQAQYAPDLNTTGLTDLTESTSAIRRIDSFPFQYRVRDVMSSPALIVESDRTPAQLATLLSNRKTSAVFVDLSGNGSAYGIVTERDLMRLLCNNDTADAATAGEIASASLRTIGQDAFIYQALGEMHAASIRHLGVKDEAGMLVGALTSGDLLRQRADDAMFLHGDLEGASNVGSLAEIWGRLPLVARSLLDEGIDASHIAAVLGEQLATMTRRAAQLAETRLREDGKGGPPAPYCVLLLGSGGRGETLLAPDQDNAIVFANGYDWAEPWFAELGHEWLSRADWRDQCYVDIFYDFCPVHGDRVLARELWDYAYSLAGKAPGFIRQLSAMATSFGAPLGFFGGLRTENGRLDLKGGGTMPIVSGARVLALRHDIRERGTRQRLLGVKELGVVNGDDIENVISAHEILLQNILEQQLLDLAAGIAPSNKIDAKRLTKRRRQELKEALEKVAVIQTAVGDPMAFG
jgi:DNA polymerase-3 subunit epsilon/CBS domain-containing protein